ncbi:hypothetical protein DM01DRAFT_1338856 [Hesseltinella vesiculosa]|uniref:Zn(2)-C6 fungal-type domain-containing protein n=1 Tax=Hesseltinella vesiculosa TaxID=101127 RepID=A0A1X2G8U2_9FUNG|nr:hypothetical protein DM01DRAFT_1338856 [Hesseltinella vesiculosa]
MASPHPLVDIRPGKRMNGPSKNVIIPRTKRTRAKRSCDHCRKKKIKCDADVNRPCSGCANSGRPCEFLVEQKKRGPASGFTKKNGYVEALESRLKRMEGLLASMAQTEASPSSDHPVATPDTDDASPSPCHDFDCQLDDNGKFQHTDVIDADELSSKLEGITLTDYDRTSYLGISSGVHLLHKSLFKSKRCHRIHDDPNWIIQKVNDESEEHILVKAKSIDPPLQGYIDRSLMLHLPPSISISQDTTDALVELYFDHFHGVFPVINKRAFLEQYFYQDPYPCDEYLLCVICATSLRILHLLSPTQLPPALLPIPLPAQISLYKALHAKVNRLTENISSRSRITTIQAMILFILFVEPPASDPEDTSYWLKTGLIVRMAQELGLHRSSSNWEMPPGEIELRRRIWYAIYSMDRWVTAELGRPISIHDHDFDVEPPSAFEIDASHPKDPATRPFVPPILHQTIQDIQSQTPLYSAFCYFAGLGRVFGQVLVRFHSPMSKRVPTAHNLQLVPIFDHSLKNWRLSLPPHLSYNVDDPPQCSPDAGMLFLAYNCILLLLYRPFITSNEDEHINFAFRALGACTMAANNILSVTESLDTTYFVRIPWTISIYAIFQAAIIFLHNAKSENPYVRDQGINNLVRCSQLMKRDCSLASSRISKVLQAIAAHFSLSLSENLPIVLPIPTDNLHHLGSKRDHESIPSGSDLDIIPHSPPTPLANLPRHPDQPPHKKPVPLDHIHASFKELLKADQENRQPNASMNDIHQIFSTRPEDMFLTSLSLGSSVSKPAPTTSIDPPLDLPAWSPSAQDPSRNLFLHQPIDLSSLSSELPLWNAPNSAHWEDWDHFLRNTNPTPQSSL